MKLSTWAKQHYYTYRTAWQHFKDGKIEGAYKTKTGTIVVPDPVVVIKPYTVVYVRVSSSENKSNLESQAKRMTDFCIANGWVVDEVIKECASGLNDTRPKLEKILTERKATRLVVEHKDRLTRFGFNYIKVLFNTCEIIVVNNTENSEADLMSDFVAVITSFCARLYGKRRTKRATEKLISELTDSKASK